jgi:hypothetical protein
MFDEMRGARRLMRSASVLALMLGGSLAHSAIGSR